MATAKIQILSDGPMRGMSFSLPNESYTIGRTENCDISMPDSTISGHHCTLFQSDAGVFYLRDEGSTNGTRVNGVKLEAGQEVPLQHGDIFQVGAIEVMYDTGEFAARSESRTMTVINLEETNTGEVDSTSMKNMAGATATKHAVILRDNKAHNAVMLTIIVLLGLTALGVMAMVAMKIFGKS